MFEKLLKLIGDNAEAKAEVTAIMGKVKDASDQDKGTIASLTSQFDAIKIEKDKYKTGNALVKKALGVTQINDETIKDRMAELGSDEAAQKLATQLAERDQTIDTLKADNLRAITGIKIEVEADKAMNNVSEFLTDDPMLRNLFRQEFSKHIGIVDDQVTPMQTVGDQRIPVVKDGKSIGLDDYAKQMLDSDYKSFKKPSTKQGAGNTGGEGDQTGGQVKANFGGSSDEMLAAVTKMIKDKG